VRRVNLPVICRYNIPELAKTHTVYAMDLLGFGFSEKALIEYSLPATGTVPPALEKTINCQVS
jgi:pimeloyl-ACP methyl ester carboxylesterase